MMKKNKISVILVIAFLILSGCAGNDTDRGLVNIAMKSDDELIHIATNGHGPEWEQLTLEEKLRIAEMFIAGYEKTENVDLKIEAVDLVDQMEMIEYGQRAGNSSTIGEMMYYLCVLNSVEIEQK